jgi:hypothetical protein
VSNAKNKERMENRKRIIELLTAVRYTTNDIEKVADENLLLLDVSQERELFKSFLEKVVEEIEMNCGDLPWELQDEAKELLKLFNCS